MDFGLYLLHLEIKLVFVNSVKFNVVNTDYLGAKFQPYQFETNI